MRSAFASVCGSARLARSGRVICLALMKTSLGDDCVAINLDYDVVKEVVQIVSGYPGDYERMRLRVGERDENFALRSGTDFSLCLSKPANAIIAASAKA